MKQLLCVHGTPLTKAGTCDMRYMRAHTVPPTVTLSDEVKAPRALIAALERWRPALGGIPFPNDVEEALAALKEKP